MFAEVKEMLSNAISGDAYDLQIILNIKACAADLTATSEFVMPGVISITRTQNQDGSWTITDNSTVTDELVILTIATWCGYQIGNPPNHDQLLASYESLKGRLRMSSTYNQEATVS